jgi:hypothetical protein
MVNIVIEVHRIPNLKIVVYVTVTGILTWEGNKKEVEYMAQCGSTVL